MRIKRLYEADDIQQAAPIEQAPNIQMPAAQEAPQHIATNMEEMPSFDQSQTADQQLLPEADVMTLTVKELMERCQKINPLICMGLEQFINLNKEQILATPNGEVENEAPEGSHFGDDEDINFSKQMEPKAPEFSLDNQGDDLQFPQG